MWLTSVFTTEKKTEPAESEALKLLQLGQHQVGFHAAAMDDGLADPDAATAKRAHGLRSPSCIVTVRFFISAMLYLSLQNY